MKPTTDSVSAISLAHLIRSGVIRSGGTSHGHFNGIDITASFYGEQGGWLFLRRGGAQQSIDIKGRRMPYNGRGPRARESYRYQFVIDGYRVTKIYLSPDGSRWASRQALNLRYKTELMGWRTGRLYAYRRARALLDADTGWPRDVSQPKWERASKTVDRLHKRYKDAPIVRDNTPVLNIGMFHVRPNQCRDGTIHLNNLDINVTINTSERDGALTITRIGSHVAEQVIPLTSSRMTSHRRRIEEPRGIVIRRGKQKGPLRSRHYDEPPKTRRFWFEIDGERVGKLYLVDGEFGLRPPGMKYRPAAAYQRAVAILDSGSWPRHLSQRKYEAACRTIERHHAIGVGS